MNNIMPQGFNSEVVWKFFHKLSTPRYFGSEGHSQAKKLIHDTFSAIPNCEYEEQLFPVKTGITFSSLVITFVFILSPILLLWVYYMSWYLAGFVFSIGIVVFVVKLIPVLGAFEKKKLQSRPTQSGTNIILRFNPSPGSEKARNEYQKVVILAHFDTISNNFHILFQALLFLGAYICGYGFLLQNLIYTGIMIFRLHSPLPAIHLIWGISISCIFIVRLLYRTENKSPGVSDNGSGVAQIYDLALKISARPLTNTQLSLVATDAEELGNLGTEAFIEHHAADLPPDRTFFIVVDTIGSRLNRIVVGERTPPKDFSPALEHIAQLILTPADPPTDPAHLEYPLTLYRFAPLVKIQSDHIPVVVNGYPCILIGGVSFDLHSKRDDFSHFDAEKFWKIVQFIEKFVYTLDQQPPKIK